MPEYLVASAVAAALVAVLAWKTTTLLREKQYWVAMLIVFAFQVPVDGWLTKAGDTIVIYDDAQTSGIRVAWNTPIEDFLFGYALITLTLVLWKRWRTA